MAHSLTRTEKLNLDKKVHSFFSLHFNFGGDNLETKIIWQRVDLTKRIDLNAELTKHIDGDI